MKGTLPAAAIPEGAVVVVEGVSFEIDHIDNANPVAGRIVWTDKKGAQVAVGGATPTEVVSLP